MAVFLDRPLGVVKQPGEVDRTPLLSYDAFSRSIAARRLAQAERPVGSTRNRTRRILGALNDMPLEGRALGEIASASARAWCRWPTRRRRPPISASCAPRAAR